MKHIILNKITVLMNNLLVFFARLIWPVSPAMMKGVYVAVTVATTLAFPVTLAMTLAFPVTVAQAVAGVQQENK